MAEDLACSLGRLRPRDAAVAVLGNHDHWVVAEEIREILRASNIVELNNEVFALKKEQAKLHIAGLDDVITVCHHLEMVNYRAIPTEDRWWYLV